MKSARVSRLFLALGVAVSSRVVAQPFGIAGPEFRVNSYTTFGESGPAVAIDAIGGFLVAWTAGGGLDGQNLGVFARRFFPSGAPASDDFRVNSYTTESQSRVAVAPLASSGGSFVVVWKNGGGGYDVVGQRYASSGAALGGEFPVSTTGAVDSVDPLAVSYGPSEFVVAWKRNGVGLSTIMARRFASTGAALSGEFQVNAAALSASHPAAAFDPNGDFVVAWSESDGFYNGIFARRFTSAGLPTGGDLQVNTYVPEVQSGPVIAQSSGRFVIAWNSHLQARADYGVYARRPCQSLAGDGTGNGVIDVADVFFLINFLFAGGPPPVHSVDRNGDGRPNG